jgi:hypothetical protein
MQPSKKLTILVWACNLVLIVLSLIIIGSSYYYTLIPGLIGLENNFEGATKYSARITQNFLSDYYTFERVIDKGKGIDTEGYYFASTRNLYSIPISDSVLIVANKIDQERSKSDMTFPDIKINKVTVSKPVGNFPVRIASPAISLSKDKFESLAKRNVISFILIGIYTFIFFWFLRKFVSGLRTPNFFNETISRYLYICASMVTFAPVLIWGWTTWVRPDLYSAYVFENAKAIEQTSSLPNVLFFFGVILLVIAWCFDQGVKLQKEQELTV